MHHFLYFTAYFDLVADNIETFVAGRGAVRTLDLGYIP